MKHITGPLSNRLVSHQNIFRKVPVSTHIKLFRQRVGKHGLMNIMYLKFAMNDQVETLNVRRYNY